MLANSGGQSPWHDSGRMCNQLGSLGCDGGLVIYFLPSHCRNIVAIGHFLAGP